MLKVRYPAALSGGTDQCVIFLSREDLVALTAGAPLRPGLVIAGMPLVIALGDVDDAETERVLSVGVP